MAKGVIVNIILGAGISGISAAYHLKQQGMDSIIYEQDCDWGGLCGNFEVDGFRFDKAIHLSFTKDKYVKEIFSKSCEYIVHKPIAYNYYKGSWLKHPAQNNLYPLGLEEKLEIISDFVENENKKTNISNYEEWLRAQYGNYFSENFPIPYTRKYWTKEARELSITWVGDRMYKPNIKEVLKGAFEPDTPNTYYAKEMRYPKYGGYKNFLTTMVSESQIRFNKKVISIDVNSKSIQFEDKTKEQYTDLISSLPLPELVKMIEGVPDKVKLASEKLWATSVALVSFGFNRADIPKHLWFYIYDENHMASRCYSPSLKSKDNVSDGCSSLQFEVYFSRHKPLKYDGDELIEHIIEKSIEMNLFQRTDIQVRDFRVLPYGNVAFYNGMEKDRQVVHDYLDEIDIKYIGRFGEWDYLWSDQSLISGMEICHTVS